MKSILRDRRVVAIIVITLVLASLGAVYGLPVTVFEDGSWAMGTFPYPLSGCLPFALCALP